MIIKKPEYKKHKYNIKKNQSPWECIFLSWNNTNNIWHA